MEIKHTAVAGTMESSDAMVTVEEGDGGIQVSITSPVIHQFGDRIRQVVLETLQKLEVRNANVTVVDRGALDCTLKARVEGAVYRASDSSSANVPWEVL